MSSLLDSSLGYLNTKPTGINQPECCILRVHVIVHHASTVPFVSTFRLSLLLCCPYWVRRVWNSCSIWMRLQAGNQVNPRAEVELWILATTNTIEQIKLRAANWKNARNSFQKWFDSSWVKPGRCSLWCARGILVRVVTAGNFICFESFLLSRARPEFSASFWIKKQQTDNVKITSQKLFFTFSSSL